MSRKENQVPNLTFAMIMIKNTNPDYTLEAVIMVVPEGLRVPANLAVMRICP